MEARPFWKNSHPSQLKNWTLFADDLINFLDQQGLINIIGMGHSLGGITTIAAALKRPDLFSKLVLIEPVLLPKKWIYTTLLMPMWLRKKVNPMAKVALNRNDTWADQTTLFNSYRKKRVFKKWSDQIIWDFINDSTFENEDEQVQLRFPKIWEAQIYCTPPNVWSKLSKIQQPTFGIRGAETDTIQKICWEDWQKKQVNATFLEMKNTGHLVPMEKPFELAQVILNFLKS